MYSIFQHNGRLYFKLKTPFPEVIVISLFFPSIKEEQALGLYYFTLRDQPSFNTMALIFDLIVSHDIGLIPV